MKPGDWRTTDVWYCRTPEKESWSHAPGYLHVFLKAGDEAGDEIPVCSAWTTGRWTKASQTQIERGKKCPWCVAFLKRSREES